MKVREEIETVVGDGEMLLRVFEELGLHVWFRYEKYREEFAHEDVIVAVDETPVGMFVEIEGGEQGIDGDGRGPRPRAGRLHARFVSRRCSCSTATRTGLVGADMVFEPRLAAPDAASARARAHGRPRHPPAAADLVRAKAAVPVAGEPLARRIVRWLAAHGVRDWSSTCTTARDTITRVRRRRRRSRRAGALLLGDPVLGSAGGPRHALPLARRAARSSSSTATR